MGDSFQDLEKLLTYVQADLPESIKTIYGENCNPRHEENYLESLKELRKAITIFKASFDEFKASPNGKMGAEDLLVSFELDSLTLAKRTPAMLLVHMDGLTTQLMKHVPESKSKNRKGARIIHELCSRPN